MPLKTMAVGRHPECVVLESDELRLAVTTQVGPRIIGAWLAGGDNLFAVLPEVPMDGIETGFELYGGHRLWHAPEAAPRTYEADNNPVSVSEGPDGVVTFSRGVEPQAGIEKSISLRPLGKQRFEVTHRLVNRNLWPVELAPWGITQMAPCGTVIIPQGRNAEANPFAVDRSLHLWPYASLADARLVLGERYIQLRQDSAIAEPCKIGFGCTDGWTACVNAGTAFIKYLRRETGRPYPDGGSNVESYTCDLFIELETLGPLECLEPDAEAVHSEIWEAVDGLHDLDSEAAIDEHLLPIVRQH